MHISRSNLTLTASTTAVSYSSQSTRLTVSARPKQEPAAQLDTVEISDGASRASALSNKLQELSPRLYLFALLLERYIGQKLNLVDPSQVDTAAAGKTPAPATDGASSAALTEQHAAQPRFGITIDAQSIRYEAQSSSFSAKGTVTTVDGRTINLDVQATISREFLSSDSLSLHSGPAAQTDPLVLDLGGFQTQLSTQKISFDVNGDGQIEQVSTPQSGSAFLALDRNGNGKIDNGNELFGPQSGNGFADLAALDTDKNGWIDEADAAYSRLRLWQPGADGQGSLQTLQQAGVGAISLQNADTPFSFRDPTTNAELGTLRSSGIFLREDGSAGTVRQIDLTA